MNDLGIIDRFMDTFSRYIDSGFGLLSGDVAFLSTTLIGIDITLAGLFWALGGEDNVIARLIKKVLGGETVGEIPMEQPARFELVINLNKVHLLDMQTGLVIV